jgi:hypothetical protein
MIEIAAAVSIANGAYKTIRKAMDAGKEAQDMAQMFGKFFDAKDNIIKANHLSQNAPIASKLLSGTSVEAQALEATAAKHKIMQLEKELREYLIWSGQGAFYEDMMAERRRIMNARAAKAKAEAENKKFWSDVITIGAVCIIGTMIIAVMIGLLVSNTP